jgi:hypothetical protein
MRRLFLGALSTAAVVIVRAFVVGPASASAQVDGRRHAHGLATLTSLQASRAVGVPKHDTAHNSDSSNNSNGDDNANHTNARSMSDLITANGPQQGTEDITALRSASSSRVIYAPWTPLQDGEKFNIVYSKIEKCSSSTVGGVVRVRGKSLSLSLSLPLCVRVCLCGDWWVGFQGGLS